MRRVTACVPAAAAWLIIASLGAQADDPHLGTWKLNQENSKAAGSDAKPHRVPAVLKIRPVENGHRFVSVFVNHRGQGVRIEYTAAYDGKQYPLTITTEGNAVWGTVSIRRVDACTLEHTFLSPSGSTTVQLSVVSSDGNTRTSTITGTNARGQKTTRIEVYERLRTIERG